MKDGLYRVHFSTPLGQGAGVIHAHDNRIWGGDAGIYYVGAFSQNGDEIQAEVKFARHTNHPGIHSVFGVDQGEIHMTGRGSETSASLTGQSPAAPGVIFNCKIDWICN